MFQRFRKRLKRSWILHGYMIASLVIMPFGGVARADEFGFELTSTESYVSVALSTPEGTSGMMPGDSRLLQVSVQRHSWEIWTNSSSGETQVRADIWTPVSGASLAFWMASGNGSISTEASLSDGEGNGYVTFTMGTSGGTVRAVASDNGNVLGEATLSFDPPEPETWAYLRTEGLLSAELTATDGGANDLASGETRQLRVHVEYATWDVEESSWGNTRTVNENSSVAQGAQISWSIDTGGDGALSSASLETGSDGNAAVTFAMGTASSTVRANVTYATSDTASATLSFNPPPPAPYDPWQFSETGGQYSIANLTVNDAASGLLPGEQRVITGTLIHEWWDVYVNQDTQESQIRNQNSAPAAGESLQAAIVSGDGSIAPEQPSTGNAGEFSVTFTMGSQASQVEVWPLSNPDVEGTVDFTPVAEVWQFMGNESGYSISLTGDADGIPGHNATLTAEVLYSEWELWQSDLGNTQTRNGTTVPAGQVPVYWVVESGDGTLSHSITTTAANGRASVGFLMGNESTRVRADLGGTPGDPGYVDGILDIEFMPEVWSYIRDEATIFVTAAAADGLPTNNVLPGTQRPVSAHVSFTRWELWQSNWGNTRIENEATGPAIGAEVNWAVDVGNGAVASTPAPQTTTDADGNAVATFVMGSETSRLVASVSYLGASAVGSIEFSPEEWVYDHSDASLSLSLDSGTASGMTVPITATATYATWEVWVKGSATWNRFYSSGAAINAPVTFGVSGGGVISPSSGDTGTNGQTGTTFSASEYGVSETVGASVSFAGLNASASLTVSVSQPPPSCSSTICGDSGCPGATQNCTCGGSGGCGGGTTTCTCTNCPSTGCTCGGNDCPGSGTTTACTCATCPGSGCSCGATSGSCVQQQKCGSSNCTCGNACAGAANCTYQSDCPCLGTDCSCSVTAGCRNPNNLERPCSSTCSPQDPPPSCSCGCGSTGCGCAGAGGCGGGVEFFLVCVPTALGSNPIDFFPLDERFLELLGKKLLIEILEDAEGLAAGSLSDLIQFIAQGSLQACFTARILGVYRTGEGQPWKYYEEDVSGGGLGPNSDIYKATPLEMQQIFFDDRSVAEEKARKFIEKQK